MASRKSSSSTSTGATHSSLRTRGRYDSSRAPVGLVGVAISARAKEQVITIGEQAVFNAPFLRNTDEAVVTDNPLRALLLLQNGIDSAPFALDNDAALAAPLFSIVLSACYSVDTGAVGGLPNLSTWSLPTNRPRHTKRFGRVLRPRDPNRSGPPRI